MQIRCFHCHKPYGLSKDVMHAALDQLEAEGLSHYNAVCPHCRRNNRVSREELLRAAPEWKKATEAEK